MDHTSPEMALGKDLMSDEKTPGMSPGRAAMFIILAAQNLTQEESHAIPLPPDPACRVCGFACDFVIPGVWIHDTRPRYRRPP
jgi:hypothetical protein